jgi:hypothetical protein
VDFRDRVSGQGLSIGSCLLIHRSHNSVGGYLSISLDCLREERRGQKRLRSFYSTYCGQRCERWIFSLCYDGALVEGPNFLGIQIKSTFLRLCSPCAQETRHAPIHIVDPFHLSSSFSEKGPSDLFLRIFARSVCYCSKSFTKNCLFDSSPFE